MAEVIKRVWRSGPRRVKKASWGYTLQINGKQERKFDASWTEDDAQAELGKRLDQIRAGVERIRECTLEQLAEEYLTHKKDAGKRSVSEDSRILKTRILPVLGGAMKVRALHEAAIARYAKGRLSQVSAYTVHNDLTVLKHMLRLARKWGYLERVPEIEMPKMPAGRLRYLDEREIARLLAACRASRNPYLATIVTIAINTGMRKSEVLDLEWERVDLATARITLYTTKSGKPRGVPINRSVYDALVALEPDQAKRTGRLYKKRDARPWGQVRSAFETAVAKAGLNDFRFHDLRHTAASHMVMRGASLKDVQEILGHADLKMTMRYAHLSPAHLRATVDRLDGLIAPLDPVAQPTDQHKVLNSAASVA